MSARRLLSSERDTMVSLAIAHLSMLRNQNPTWSIDDLLVHLRSTPNPFLVRLAQQCGFYPVTKPRGSGDKDPDCAASAGYGRAPFGVSAYGSNRRRSDGRCAVIRKVTRAGQLYYRGYRYTLGTRYRERLAMLTERGPRLEVAFADRPALDLAARHWTPT